MSDREMLDSESRLCVKMKGDRGTFNFVRQNMPILDAREVCQRIALFIRNYESGISQSRQVIDSFEFFPLPTSEWGKVCVVWNEETKQIRFSVEGMSLWDAAIVCEHAAVYFSAMLINPVEVQAKEFGYVGTDDEQLSE